MAQARKIVFIQYLFGLAVVEAVRGVPGYEDIGVRLKWPNDVYGDVGGVGTDQYRKIGGILVNSSYAGDDFTLVVGVFLLSIRARRLRLTTLAQAAASTPPTLARRPRSTSSSRCTTTARAHLSLPSAKRVSSPSSSPSSAGCGTRSSSRVSRRSRIRTSSDGSTRTSLPSPVARALADAVISDQRVTIEASSQVVRIVGITPDHGLLRTVPIDVDRNGKEVFGGGAASKAFVDLQPDGNGFDMIKRLVVSRST